MLLPLSNTELFPGPVQLPELVLVAVTLLEVVSNTKPDGVFNIIVPIPISPSALSAIIGLVKVVYVPPVVSAEIAEPPVASVTVTPAAANAILDIKKLPKINADDNIYLFIFIKFL